MTDTDTQTDIGQWPTKKELVKFIEVFDRLCRFEGEQRMLRGYGVFNDLKVEPIPIPEVMTVSRWLSNLVKGDSESGPQPRG